MILSGSEICRQLRRGKITIHPFAEDQVNPNSYNYRLARSLRISKSTIISAKSEWVDIDIPRKGIVLSPGRLYLGCTEEMIGSAHFVPILIGKSSLGRLGVFLTASADLGNLGRAHRWTLEIKVVQKIRIYPLMEIGQVSFWKPTGGKLPYNSAYTHRDVPQEFLKIS